MREGPKTIVGTLRAHEIGRERYRLLHVARADAELLVHDGRVVEEEFPLSARRAAVVDELDVALFEPEEARRVLARISDRRRRADEQRARPVKARDAHQAADHVGDVRPEDAAVRVELVDDDVLQRLERARPRGVVREDPGVEHVRVRHDDAAPLARRAPRVTGRVAVVRDDAHASTRLGHQLADGRLLIARERLGRKEIERARVRIAHQRVEDGQVKAQALAARGRRRDDEGLLHRRDLERARLVRVESVDAARAKRPDERRVERLGQGSRARIARGVVALGREARPHALAREPSAEHGLEPALRFPRSGPPLQLRVLYNFLRHGPY